jgi:hypothetical protein
MAHPVARRKLSPSMVAAVVTLSIMLAGCSELFPIGAGGVSDREHRQAEEALARWADAVAAAGGQQSFVPVGELTGQLGDWEAEVGDNNKMALMAGKIVVAANLDPTNPPDAEIRWDDGTTKSFPAISAAQALEDLRKAAPGSDCPECVSLLATSARLGTARIQTSRGPATAPVWEFTLAGTSVVVTRVAIAAGRGVNVTAPAWNPNDAPVGLSIESAAGSPDGMQLTVTFTGAPERADKPCGEDYTAEAVESATAIVVIVVRQTNGFLGACSAVGASRTATVTLAQPLGDRAVLEVQQGLPVTVRLTQ